MVSLPIGMASSTSVIMYSLHRRSIGNIVILPKHLNFDYSGTNIKLHRDIESKCEIGSLVYRLPGMVLKESATIKCI